MSDPAAVLESEPVRAEAKQRSLWAGGWRHQGGASLPEVFRSVRVPQGSAWWRKALAFAGPGFLVSVGYMDPGNWATDLAGGARYG